MHDSNHEKFISIQELNNLKDEQELEIAALHDSNHKKFLEISDLKKWLDLRGTAIKKLKSSFSWKITIPVRLFGMIVKFLLNIPRLLFIVAPIRFIQSFDIIYFPIRALLRENKNLYVKVKTFIIKNNLVRRGKILRNDKNYDQEIKNEDSENSFDENVIKEHLIDDRTLKRNYHVNANSLRLLKRYENII